MHSAHASHAVLGGSSTCSFLTRFAVDEGQNHWSSGKLGFGIPPPVRTARLEAQSSTRHRYSSQIRAYLSSASEALLPWEYQPVISISFLASKSTLYLTEKTARKDDHSEYIRNTNMYFCWQRQFMVRAFRLSFNSFWLR